MWNRKDLHVTITVIDRVDVIWIPYGVLRGRLSREVVRCVWGRPDSSTVACGAIVKGSPLEPMSSTSVVAVGRSLGCTEVGVVVFADSRVRNHLKMEVHMRAIGTVGEAPFVLIGLRRGARRILCASNITLRTSDCGETQK